MRTYIVADQPQLQSAIQFLLDHQPHIRVIERIDHIKLVLAQIEAAHPDLIMVDWDMFGHATIELLTTLGTLGKRPKIVVLSLRPEVEGAALQAGADIFICKSDSPEKLVAILNTLVENETQS